MPLPPQSKKSQQLMAAARRGDAKRVRALLKEGCDPDEADRKGMTPLHAAVEAGHLAAVKALVEDGHADINALDKKGRTPYDIASDHDVSQYPPKTFFYLNGKAAKHGWQVKQEAKKKGKKKPAKKQAAKAAPERGGEGFSGVVVDALPAPRPKFTEATLKDTFNPAGWVGKTAEMEKLWEEVPKKLQAKFDFAAALSEAKRQSMRKTFPAIRVLKPKKP